MPWWAAIYIGLVAFVGTTSAAYDANHGASRGRVVIDLLATAALLAIVLAYFVPSVAAVLGRSWLPLLIAVIARVVHQNARDAPEAPKIPRAQEWFWVTATAAFYAPAIAAGMVVVIRAW
jgi:hypothetical protein